MADVNSTPRRSRWFQFGLRTLFALMILVGAYFAGFATSQTLAEKAIQDAQEKATAELQAAQRASMEAQERADLAAKYEAVARAQAEMNYARRIQQATSQP